MNNYKIGNILYPNEKVFSTSFKEAIILHIDEQKEKPYYVFSLMEYGSGYSFGVMQRRKEELDKWYLDCIVPHFCNIRNLYNLLKDYEFQLLGTQICANVSILYMKTSSKYIQIFISNHNYHYDDWRESGMFVYIYETNDFESLKLVNNGNFWFYRNKNHNPIEVSPYIQKNDSEYRGLYVKDKGSDYMDYIFRISHSVYKGDKDGLEVNKLGTKFQICSNMEDFKGMIGGI